MTEHELVAKELVISLSTETIVHHVVIRTIEGLLTEIDRQRKLLDHFKIEIMTDKKEPESAE